jgi:cytochrome c biogenesis protein CcmG, thiol:disulfide interchange protein DsbE
MARARTGLLALLPLTTFLLIGWVFWEGLQEDPSEIPSVLIGKPAPRFALEPLPGLMRENAPVPGLATADLASGRVALVNVWASWCGPCRLEHPILMRLATRQDLRLFGINYKDDPEDARRFLGSLGLPYERVGIDPSGRASLDWGVYGVPETFIVDGAGIVRFKWVGPITEEALARVIDPEIAKARQPF